MAVPFRHRLTNDFISCLTSQWADVSLVPPKNKLPFLPVWKWIGFGFTKNAEALLLGLVPQDSKIMRLAAGNDDLRPLIPVQISRLDVLHRRLLAT